MRSSFLEAVLAVAALVFGSVAIPNSARAEDQSAWPPTSISVFGSYGACCKADYSLQDLRAKGGEGTPLATQDLAGTFGGGIRMDWAYEYLAVSADFGVESWTTAIDDVASDERFTFAHLAATLRFRAPFANERAEIFAGIPIGLGLSFSPSGASDIGTGWGVRLGVLVGAYFYFVENFGIVVDTGLIANFLFHDATPMNSQDSQSLRIITYQSVTTFGLVYRFGSAAAGR